VFKKILSICFLFFAFLGQETGAQTTIDFNNLSDNLALGLAYDREGFTFAINIDQNLGRQIVSKTGLGFGGTTTLYDNNVTVGGITRWTITRNGGAEFQFRSIYLQDAANGADLSGTIQGFKNGVPVGTQKAIQFNSGFTGLKDFVADADFFDVDEIRIESSDINFYLDHFTYGPVFVPVDTDPVQVTSIAPQVSSTFATSVDYVVNFNKTALNVSTDDFQLTTTGSASGGISSISGSGNNYTVTVNSISPEGTLRLDLRANTNITNANGNTGTNAFTSGQVFNSTFCFTETFESGTIPDAATSFASNGRNFTLGAGLEIESRLGFGAVNPGGSGNSNKYIKNNNTAGTFSLSSAQDFTMNTLDIFLSDLSNGDNPTATGSITVRGKKDGTIVFSILKTSGFPTTATVNGGFFTLNFATDGTENYRNVNIDELEFVIADGFVELLLDNFQFCQEAPDVDTQAPRLISSIPNGAALSTATTVDFDLIFDENALNVTTDDFVVFTTGTASGSVSGLTGIGSQYVVTVSGISGEGSIRLDLGSGNDIADALGNTPSPVFTSGQEHLVGACFIETFEDEISGSASFSGNGLNFNLTGNWTVSQEAPTTGIGGSKLNLKNTGAGPYSINSADRKITVNQIALYLSSFTSGSTPTNDGTVTIKGFNGTTEEFSVTKSSGFNTSLIQNSGYTFIDFSTESGQDNSNTLIDRLEISLGGSFVYLNLDNFEWCQDAVAPSGYGIAIDQDLIVASNETAVSFSFARAELGTTYEYTFTSDGGGTPVTDTGIISTASGQITGIDLSGLINGTITLSFTLTDPSGNEGSPATDTKEKETITTPVATAPSAPVVNEDISVDLADDIQITDADGDNQTVIFTITGGTLTVGTSGITFGGSGNGSASFTAAGTLAEINAALDAATFTPSLNLNGTGAGTISFVSNDGAADSNTASVTFGITAVNDDPTFIGLPTDITVQDGIASNVDLSSATFGDVDSGAGDVSLSFLVSGGTLSATSGGGVTVTFPIPGAMNLAGTAADIETFLNTPSNIQYTNAPGSSGDNAATLSLSANDNGNTGTGGGTGVSFGSINIDVVTIPTVTLSVTPTSKIESTTSVNTVTATLSNSISDPVTINLGFSGTAIGSGVDYTSSGTSITITPGNTTGSISLTNIPDALFEGNESVIIDITGVTNGNEDGVQQVTYTILDDDSPPNANLLLRDIYNPVTDESGGQVYIVAQLDAVAGTTVSIPLSFSGTATGGGTDYSLTSSTIVLSAGETADSVRLTSLFDGIEEGDETVIVDMDTPTNAVESGTQQVIITIEDEDAAAPTVTSVTVPSNATYIAGQNLDFTINFSESVTVGGTPQLSLTIGSTERQAVYQSGSGLGALLFRYTVQPGELDNDGIAVGTLAANGGTLRDAVGNNANLILNSVGSTTAVLVDAAAPSGYSVSIDQDPILPINESNVSFTFSGAEVGATYNYTFSSSGGGTSVSGSGTILTSTDQITGIDLSGLGIGTITLSVTLTDNFGNVGAQATDSKNKISTTSVSVDDPSIAEGDAGTTNLQFTVSLSDPAPAGGATVDFSTSDGTGIAGSDYTAIPTTTLSFLAGESSKTVDVSITGEETVELDETLTLTLSNPTGTGVIIADATGEGTIINDDQAAVNIGDVTVNENSGTATITLTLDNAVDGRFSVDVSTSDGTATTADADYTSVITNLTFAGTPGEVQTFQIPITDDSKVELDETVSISMSGLSPIIVNAADINITDGATLAINNDDQATVTIADFSGNEDDGAITVTVTLDNAVDGGFDVDVSTADGTATTADSDYFAIAGQTLTFAGTAGEMETFSVTPAADAVPEADEAVSISMSGLTPTTVASGDIDITDRGTVTILNDDINAPSTPDLVASSDSGISDTDNITNDRTPTLQGTADPNITIEIISSIDGSLGTTTSNSTGQWEFTPLSELSPTLGAFAVTHEFIARTTDGFGNIGNSIPLTVVIDTMAPTPIAINGFVLELDITGTANLFPSDLLAGISDDFSDPANIRLEVSKGSFDCSDKGIQFVRLIATDEAGNSDFAESAVLVQDNAFPCPTLTILATTQAAEDNANGVFTVSTSSQFATNTTVTFTIEGTAIPGTDYVNLGTSFVFPANTNSVTITVPVIGDDLDENDEEVILTLTGTDNAAVQVGTPSQANLIIADNDETPVVVAGQSFNLAENAANNSLIGTILATDTDAGTVFQSWMISSGNDDGIFGIDLGTGELSVVDNSNLDFESNTQYLLEVTVTDGINTSAAEEVIINLTDVNDVAPIINPNQVFAVKAGDPNTTSLGTVLAKDGDVTPTTFQSWTITAGNVSNDGDADPPFAIDSNTGEITINDTDDINTGNLNYTLTITVSDGVNTSTPETVQITGSQSILNVTANAGQTKIFGTADPAFTFTATGFEVGDDETILTGALSRTTGEDVGLYGIEFGSLDAGNKYVINFTGADFEITPAVLDLTVDAGQMKLFGEADPVFSYNAIGFKNGDTEAIITGSLIRLAGEDVGLYAIQPGTIDAGGNYTINFTGSDFEITPAVLDITADAGQMKVFGEADPVFSYNATGFKNGDTEAIITGSLIRLAGEDVGLYAIQPGTIDAGGNYTINFTGADFEITPAAITGITFDDGSFVFDGTEKSIVISGTLPEGTPVAYAKNTRTDVGTQEATATITGSNFNDLVLTADLTITPAAIAGITFDDGSFVFDGTEKNIVISGTLPAGTSVAYANNTRTNVGNQEATATITGSNFNDLVLTADLTITPADIAGITFDDGNFVFDGTAKTLEIAGTLPAGTSVAYTNNSRTDVGQQEATATISGSNFTTLVLTADLTITPAAITGVTFDDGNFVFDGTEKSIVISGTLPEGTSVAYANNTRTDVGQQEATATVSGSNFTTLVLTADLTITPAAIAGITFEDGSFVFDGTAKSIVISGTLPAGTSVAYAKNTRTDVGTQEATATITGSNFNDLVLTADLTITPAAIAGITFDDGSFVFDGTEKSIVISGTLPAGTSVAYANNTRTDVGTQEATATITGSNFNDLVLTADLTITPAAIAGITFDDGSFVFDGTEKSIVISGTLPEGTSVAYVGNTRTDVGTQEATATITGSNFNDLVLTANLTITPAELMVTADEGQSKLFGEDDPELTFTASGYGAGDDASVFSGALSREAGEAVGFYAISQGTLDAGMNYTIAFTGADFEIITNDSDGDGVPDDVEEMDGTDPDDPDDFKDSDEDGVPDYVEEEEGTDPEDGHDFRDSDGDGVPDYKEEREGTDPDDSDDFRDSDGDGVSDYEEDQDGTDPDDPDDFRDSDGDGVPDKVEEDEGSDPEDSTDYPDTDEDGVPDYKEEREGTDPENGSDFVDENGNGIPDYLEERSVVEFVAQSIEVPWGTLEGDLSLPDEVIAITGMGAFINVPVEWDLTGYNPFIPASNNFSGEAMLPAGLFNALELNPTLEITVAAKPAPQDVTLSSNSFVAIPDVFFQEIGVFTVIDPTDDIHTLSLSEGVLDNDFFEVIDGILFWSSAEQAPGRTKFTIQLSVVDRGGNVLEKNFQIERQRTPLDQLDVPNTFTPNGDNVNDLWGVPALRYYEGVKISVFDLGNNRLFYTEDPDQRWDGTFNGSPQPVGAYLYVIEVEETGEVRRGMLNLLID